MTMICTLGTLINAFLVGGVTGIVAALLVGAGCWKWFK